MNTKSSQYAIPRCGTRLYAALDPILELQTPFSSALPVLNGEDDILKNADELTRLLKDAEEFLSSTECSIDGCQVKTLRPRCKDCGRSFTNRKDLRRHARSLHGVNDTVRYWCSYSYCNKAAKQNLEQTGFGGWARKDDLQRHMRTRHKYV